MDKRWNGVVCRAASVVVLFGLWGVLLSGCGSDDAEETTCISDRQCSGDLICVDRECVSCECDIDHGEGECLDDGSCEIVACDAGYVEDGGECVEDVDCECDIDHGEGECLADGSCEIVSCDEGYVEDDGECVEEEVECECEIENGEGECLDDGSCELVSCDEGYVEEEGQCVEEQVECECEIENGEGSCDDEGNCVIAECDPGYSTDDDDPETGCECAPTDVPDPVNFTDANCDGVDGDASRAVFVSLNGDDDDDGVPHRPVRTINRAIDIASDDGDRDHIYLDQGIYDEVLRIEEAVNIYGGFRETGTGDWERDEDSGESIITGRGIDREPRPVQITGIDDDMEIQKVTIEAADGESEQIDGETVAGSSVAVTLVDNEGEVTLSHVSIEAGAGMDATDSPSAASGASGAGGGEALDSEGASGGATQCDFSEDTQGGDGGYGGAGDDHDGQDDYERDGQDGEDASAQDGGAAGGAGGDSKDTCEGLPVDTSGGDGESGANPGSSGEDGGSTPVTSTLGYHGVSETGALILYRGNRGEDGTDGTSGDSGGGGGGSGWNGINTPISGGCESSWGRGGGGGGAGGCGGEGGKGGQWGGVSVGVMALNASVSIVAGSIATADGGDGANGAAGGEGGDGGDGGAGALSDGGSLGGFMAGGDGGDGQSGGDGGHGAGGEGGLSVGVLHDDSEVDVAPDVVFELGNEGQGGDTPDESNSNDGPAGLRGEVWGYDD